MRLIDLYDYCFLITKRNSKDTQKKIEEKKANKETNKEMKWKELGMSYQYRDSNYERLQTNLASTIGLLTYSKTACKLISEEVWGKELLKEITSDRERIETIKERKAKETDSLIIDSAALNLLFIIFFSYNTLYMSSQNSTRFGYTSLLNDFKQILIMGPNGEIVKNESIEESIDSIVSDYCLYRILKSTSKKLDICRSDKGTGFVHIMKYMESSLKYFYKEFMGYGQLITTSELETQLDVLEEYNSRKSLESSIKGYSELNEIMHSLKDSDILLIEDVINELFSFQPSNAYIKKVEEESNDMELFSELDYNINDKLDTHMTPFKRMWSMADIRSEEGNKIMEINKKFP